MTRVGAEVLEHGLAARPAGPQKVKSGSKLTRAGGEIIERPIYIDGEWLPAQPAVPPLRRLVDLRPVRRTPWRRWSPS